MDFSSSVFIVLESFLRFYTYFISYFSSFGEEKQKDDKNFWYFWGWTFQYLVCSCAVSLVLDGCAFGNSRNLY